METRGNMTDWPSEFFSPLGYSREPAPEMKCILSITELYM